MVYRNQRAFREGLLSCSVAQDHAFCAVERIRSRDDDLIARRQSLENFHFGDAGGAELHRVTFGDVAVN